MEKKVVGVIILSIIALGFIGYILIGELMPKAELFFVPTVTVTKTVTETIPGPTVTVTVIEGTFDVAADGDLIYTPFNGDEWHWKKISVLQLTLSDMPLVKVYLKPYGRLAEGWPNDSWIDAGVDFCRLPINAIAYDEHCVLILYKRVILPSGETDIFITGEYKIVVVK